MPFCFSCGYQLEKITKYCPECAILLVQDETIKTHKNSPKKKSVKYSHNENSSNENENEDEIENRIIRKVIIKKKLSEKQQAHLQKMNNARKQKKLEREKNYKTSGFASERSTEPKIKEKSMISNSKNSRIQPVPVKGQPQKKEVEEISEEPETPTNQFSGYIPKYNIC